MEGAQQRDEKQENALHETQRISPNFDALPQEKVGIRIHHWHRGSRKWQDDTQRFLRHGRNA